MMHIRIRHQTQRQLTQGAIVRDSSAPQQQMHQVPSIRLFRLASLLRRDVVVSVAIFALSLDICLYQARTNSVWLDEAFSVGFSQLRWPVLWRYIWGVEGHMALYYVLLRGWIWLLALAGLAPTELAIRLPSLLCVALSAVVVFQFGRRFLGEMAGSIGALLYLMNFLVLVQGDEARSYGLQLLFVCVSWYALVAALTDGASRRWWVVYTVFGTLQIYAEVFSVLILGAQLAAFVCLLALGPHWRARFRSAAGALAGSVACMLVLAAPILYDALLHGRGNDWIPPAQPSDLAALLNPLGGGVASLAPLLLAIGLLELTIVIVARVPMSDKSAGASSRLSQLVGGRAPALLHSARSAELPLAVVALTCWLVLPILFAYLFTQPGLNVHLFLYAYFAICAPAYCLLAGLCVAVTRWRFAQVILAIVLLAFSLRTLPTARDSANYDAWHAPALWLEQHYAQGDGMVCIPDTWCAIPMDYYLFAYRSHAHFDSVSPGAWDWQQQTSYPTSPEALATYASQHDRIFLVSYNRVEFGAASAQGQQLAAVKSWLDQYYWPSTRVSSTTYLSTITVTLYIRLPSPSTVLARPPAHRPPAYR